LLGREKLKFYKIPIEFYKALIPPDDENLVNNSASGLNCLQKIYSRIWNGEFPSTWNEASIISIPKKGDDLSDCVNSVKAEFYDKNKFEETSNFIKLCYEYPDLSYGFYWLLRARSGYRLDARIAKAAKIVDQMCPNFCPCCKNNK